MNPRRGFVIASALCLAMMVAACATAPKEPPAPVAPPVPPADVVVMSRADAMAVLQQHQEDVDTIAQLRAQLEVEKGRGDMCLATFGPMKPFDL